MHTDIIKRIDALRNEMKKSQLNAYIIPSADPHLSEYPAKRWESRAWISGFTGSAGTVIITDTKAGLWTDSRYFLQAEHELEGSGIELYRMGLPETDTMEQFLLSEIAYGEKIGTDGKTFSAEGLNTLQYALDQKKIAIQSNIDLIESVWKDRPSLPLDQLYLHDATYSGVQTQDKLIQVNNKLQQAGADCTLLCMLDEIAWTFNIRGNDVNYNPVVVSYAFVSEDQNILFVALNKVTKETQEQLIAAGVTIAPYDSVESFISQLPTGTRIFVDQNRTNATLYNAIPNDCIKITGDSPVSLLKSIKNSTEIAGFRNAMIKDGVAMTRFYIWLEQAMVRNEKLTECSISERLSHFRSLQPLYAMDSFGTICGYAAHGAIVHYHATPETDATLHPEGMLLIDAGGQYLDGTTDITRTWSLGQTTDAQRKDFTRVLKGHISLAKCKFPQGTRGSQLDILARKSLWDCGLNYLHGTGHGIGHFLNVHEGPQSIRMDENSTTLQPGMVLSNEPGLYRTDAYGIRIENLILVREDSQTEFGTFYSFETLTLCPIDSALIDTSMLSVREHAWLNKYHQMVYDRLAPHLTTEEATWLKNKTEEI
jgi:Xaa-Pro aminopeptidase